MSMNKAVLAFCFACMLDVRVLCHNPSRGNHHTRGGPLNTNSNDLVCVRLFLRSAASEPDTDWNCEL